MLADVLCDPGSLFRGGLEELCLLQSLSRKNSVDLGMEILLLILSMFAQSDLSSLRIFSVIFSVNIAYLLSFLFKDSILEMIKILYRNNNNKKNHR